MKNLYRLAAGLAGLLLTSTAPTLAQTFTQAQAVAPASNSSGSSNVLELVTDYNGSSYVTGYFAGTVTIGGTTLTSVGGNDVFVAKYDAAGVAQWAVRGGGAGDDIATAIALDTNGNLGIAGAYGGSAAATFGNTLLGNAGDLDMFVAKLDLNGAWQWAQRMGGNNTELGQGVAFDSGGNLLAVGFYRSPSITLSGTTTTYANPTSTLAYSLLLKYSSSGAFISSNNFTSSNSIYVNVVALDASNNVYLFGDFGGTANVGGTTLSSVGGQDVFVAKLTPALAVSWARRAGGTGEDLAPSGRAILIDNLGNAYVTGRSYSTTITFGSTTPLNNGNINGEVYVASISDTGTWNWATRAGGPSEDQGESLSVGRGNTLYVTGNFRGTATFGSTTLTSAGGTDAYVGQIRALDGVWTSANRAGGTLDDGGTGVARDLSNNLYCVGYYASSPASFSAISLTNAGTQTGYFARSLDDLTVNTLGDTSGGIYNNVTIASGGSTSLAIPLVANGTMVVQSGGTLNLNCQPLTGAGSFTLAAGGALYICNPLGIVGSGASGAVQVNGARSFSPDASYYYNGTAAQVTGNALPAQVRALGTLNASSVTLTSPVRVAQTLTVGAAGNLVTNSNALTLLSSAAGTALAVNSGPGAVAGNVTVQRYIDGTQNPGLGYRHYSAPVANTTVADLATSGFTPELSMAATYNSSATPGATRPFPNVFGYDQGRLATTSNNTPVFDKGWYAPAGTSAPLTVGQGYTVNLAAGQLVDFVGSLNNGDLTVNLSRNAGATAPNAGWALVGNPYPAPLDFSKVVDADRNGLDASMYVVQSSSQYAAGYRSYVNGQSTSTTNNPLIASSQGFFVRVSQGRTSGSLTFRNTQRVVDYASQVSFQRPAADLRPLVRLELAGGTLADNWVAYAEAGATAAFDGAYDAAKLNNPSGLNLSSVAGPEHLAIDGRPALAAGTVLPLAVGVPAAGTYTFTALTLANLPAGLTAWLRDLETGQQLPLAVGSRYSFQVTAAQAQALLTGRFTVQFGPSAPLAATSATLAGQVSVYPNPAHDSFVVALPGVDGASAVQAELLNSLGQVVLRQQAALPASGASLRVATAQLPAGIYTLRLTAGPATVVQRVTVE